MLQFRKKALPIGSLCACRISADRQAADRQMESLPLNSTLPVATRIDITRLPTAESEPEAGVGPERPHTSVPRECCRCHTSSSGGVGGPDPTPRLKGERSGR
jgi:hypothetical protein